VDFFISIYCLPAEVFKILNFFHPSKVGPERAYPTLRINRTNGGSSIISENPTATATREIKGTRPFKPNIFGEKYRIFETIKSATTTVKIATGTATIEVITCPPEADQSQMRLARTAAAEGLGKPVNERLSPDVL
jgi:hypothetical protein